MKPKNFTYLELCKANGYGLTMLSDIYLYIDEPTFKYIPNLYYFYDVH